MMFATRDGRMFDHPELLACGLDGATPRTFARGDLIEVPRGSDLFALPGRAPVGIDPATGRPVVVREFEGEPIDAVAAFMAPAHTQSMRPAYVRREQAPALPLYAYTAMGYADGKFWVPAARVDRDRRQDPWRFDSERIERAIEERAAQMPRNRVALQLVRCAQEYGCRAAQNWFLGRWEAPLPASIACNAQCIGCISLQPRSTEFLAAHDRLRAAPTARELADVALDHLTRVPDGVVSFGQGCEGEPLMMGELLVETVRLVRRATSRGTVNLNTNGSRPEVVAEMVLAGLDSIRVSINSARPDVHRAYYRPRKYGMDEVVECLSTVGRQGGFRAINLLYFPGVTDTPAEVDALCRLIEHTGLDMIQLRNLNADPDVYVAALPPGTLQEGMGLRPFMRALRRRFPHLRFGYFNPPRERFAQWWQRHGRLAPRDRPGLRPASAAQLSRHNPLVRGGDGA